MSNEPSPGSDNSINQTVGRGRAALVDDSPGPKLGLPQHRYCKPEIGQENKLDGPIGTYFKLCCCVQKFIFVIFVIEKREYLNLACMN
jgi:hypothetical protein